MALDLKAAMEIDEKRRLSDRYMNKLIELPEVRKFLAAKLKELIGTQG